MAATLQPPPIDTPQDGPDGLFSTVWQRFFISLRAISQLWTQQPFVTYKASTDLTSPQNLGLLATGFLKTTLTGAVATISSAASIPVASGGTGDTSLTAHGVLIGEGTLPVAVTAAGAAKTVLIGQGAADPIFSGSPEVTSMIVDLALTADSPTLVVDSINHRVGIGTASPTRILNVQHTGGAVVEIDTTDVATNSTAQLQVVSDATVFSLNSHGSARVVNRWGFTIGGWNELLGTNNSGTSNGIVIGNLGAKPIVFGVSSSEVARFDTAGSLGINTTAPLGGIDVETQVGSVSAKFGAIGAFYLISNDPILGFNIYYSGGFKYGKGSVAVYGATCNFSTAGGQVQFTATQATGNANAAATMTPTLTINKDGSVGTGTASQLLVDANGKIATYNAIATVSGGVPSEYATINTTGLTANVAASTLYAVPASGEGMYRVSAYVVETVAGSVSSVLPNVQILYTDKDSNVAVTIDATPILGAAGLGQTGALNANTGGTVSSGVIVIYVKASTTIQYQTSNYASVAAGMTYALRIRLELL